MKAKYYIGIDPDVTASGVCIWDSEAKEIVHLECMKFYELFDQLTEFSVILQYDGIHTQVIVDAGWLNGSNFHAKPGQTHRVSAQIGERTGANHEVGKKIIEMCEYLGLSVELHRPTKSKVDAKYFKQITKYTKRTNQDQRDAAMLVVWK